MRHTLVIDTNLLLNATHAPDGASAAVLELIDREEGLMAVSKAVNREYDHLLALRHIQQMHQHSRQAIAALISRIRGKAQAVRPERRVTVVTDDPSDNKFLSCALAADADYIISTDSDLLRLGSFEGIAILTPKEYLQQRQSR